jgi:endonuclease I
MKPLLLAFLASTICATAPAQILITQYYEGTGTNKWIELTNLGTSAVNTASPQLRLGIWSASGSAGNINITGTPTATMDLNVTIPARTSVVIGNTGNGTEVSYLTATSAAQTNNTIINFNGNDGIALLNSSNTILDRCITGINAPDISYVRSTSVTAQSATYVSSQWISQTLSTISSAGTTSANRLGYHIAATTTGGNTGAGAYYNAASGLTCQALKTKLKQIITTGFNNLTYTPGIWNLYYFSDKRRNDGNTADIVWDMYSDNPTGADPYTYTLGSNQCGSYSGEGGCYNREHSTPQSWFNSASPMVSDAHHIFATDGYVNALRSSYPYGEVTSATNTTRNGSKLGTGSNNFGYTGTVFEPRNEYKGDFARACLYMAVRYEDEIINQNWSSLGTANAVFLSTNDQANAAKRRLLIYDPWFLQLMIKWHTNDPVSQKEIDRNNAIFNQAVVNSSSGTTVKQNNRNPFIDKPEYVAAIWGTGTGGSCTAALAAVAAPAAKTEISVYPNPTHNNITVASTAAINKIELLNQQGTLVWQNNCNGNVKNVTVAFANFLRGVYTLRVTTPKGVEIKQITKY